MSIIEELVYFVQTKTLMELVSFFWYFVIFDFARYIVSDVLVISYYFYKRKREKPIRNEARKSMFEAKPLISILVPGKNEGKHIPKLAQSLKEQTYKNLEIIIVDDGSDDDSAEICRDLLKKGLITKFFRNEIRGGKASAANLALRYATGEFIVHLDADSHLRHDSIEKILIPFFLDEKIGAVAGDIRVNNLHESIATSLQAIEYMKTLSTGRTVSSTFGILRIISGAYGAFRKDILDKLKGWDVGPGLDGDITLKIRKGGHKVVFEVEAVCYTNVPTDFYKLAKQRYRWDRSLVRFRLRKHLDLLDVTSKNFTFTNFLTSVDNILYNFILNINWWMYIVYSILFNTVVLKQIAILNYLLYFMTNVIEYTLASLLFGRSMRREEFWLIFYLPLMPFYTGFYLRFIRSYAHLMELFFKVSYEDKWNPWKVSKLAKREKL